MDLHEIMFFADNLSLNPQPRHVSHVHPVANKQLSIL